MKAQAGIRRKKRFKRKKSLQSHARDTLLIEREQQGEKKTVFFFQ
jgi:hypothetical protein